MCIRDRIRRGSRRERERIYVFATKTRGLVEGSPEGKTIGPPVNTHQHQDKNAVLVIRHQERKSNYIHFNVLEESIKPVSSYK